MNVSACCRYFFGESVGRAKNLVLMSFINYTIKEVFSVGNVIKISYRVPSKMGSSVVSLTLIRLAVYFTALQVVIAQGERESLPDLFTVLKIT